MPVPKYIATAWRMSLTRLGVIHLGIMTSTRHTCLLQVTSSIPSPLLQPQKMWHSSWQAGGLAQASCSGNPFWPPSSSLLTLQGKSYEATFCFGHILLCAIYGVGYVASILLMQGGSWNHVPCAFPGSRAAQLQEQQNASPQRRIHMTGETVRAATVWRSCPRCCTAR